MNKIKVKKLSELADVIAGVSIPSDKRLKKGKWQLIRGRKIVKNTVLESDVFIPTDLAKKYSRAIIVPGDILLSTHFEQYKVGIVPSSFKPAIADRSILIIRTRAISKEYLQRYLISKTGKSALVGQLATMVRGSIIKFVTAKDVMSLDIPILPTELIDVSERHVETISKIKELMKMFEIEVVENVKEFLKDKGWKDENISLEHPISGRMRADIVLLRKGKPIALIEVKKDQRGVRSVLQQITMMGKIAGVKKSYLISGDGLKEIDVKKGKVKDIIDLPTPEEAKK